MAKTPNLPPNPLLYVKYSPEFKEAEWSTLMTSPFEVNTQLQALLVEAESRGMGVVVQAALIPIEAIYGKQPDENEETDNDNPNP